MLRLWKKNENLHTKIIFIAPDINSGGAENILYNVAKNQNNKDITIISLTDIGFYGNKLKDSNYKIYALNMKKNLFLIIKLLYLIILIRKIKPKFVQTWLYHGNLIGGIAAKIAGIKNIIWTIHHDFESGSLIMNFEMKILILLSYIIPNKIIYGSWSSKFNHFKNGYIKCKSLVIDNGVSMDKFKPISKLRFNVRSELNISKNCILIGNISRYNPIKDHDTLLKTLKLLKNEGIDFKCIMVGIGLDENNIELKYKITNYELSKNIILYGRTFQMNKIINSFDLNLLTSIRECSPISILESMSVGIPCISTDVGDASRLIGNSGWVFPTYDYKSIASCIVNISKKKNILKYKSSLARKRIRENFLLNDMVIKYKNLYK